MVIILFWRFGLHSVTCIVVLTDMGNALSLVASIGVPLLGGTAIGLSARQDVIDWYELNRTWVL